MFLHKFIRQFLIIILGGDVEADQQEVFVVWDMPVPGRLAPSAEFDLAAAGNPQIVKVEVFVGDTITT